MPQAGGATVLFTDKEHSEGAIRELDVSDICR